MRTVAAKVSEDEYQEISELAKKHNISISKLIKMSLFEAEVSDPKPLENLNIQVRKIGVNFNQITRFCNYKKQYHPLAKSALHEIYLDLGDLLNDE